MKPTEEHVTPQTTDLNAATVLGQQFAAESQSPDKTRVAGDQHVGTQAGTGDAVQIIVAESESTPAARLPEAGGRERFKILRSHARGGLGQVSVALDQQLNREVAFKEIQPQHADNAASRERFVYEAQITGGLEHPGIVPVYALGQDSDGRPFYAMRFVKGDSLKQAIDDFHRADNPNRNDRGARELARRQLLGRFIDVCNAMDYAHSRGVLHCDLKPGNIMVGKYGETLVVDWGLAKSVEMKEFISDEVSLHPSSALSSSAQTQFGSALGTPAYMSPEQAAGKLNELGPATDVYSLGATLFHLLCGRPPFEKRELAETLARVRLGEFPKPRSLSPDIPRALEAICLKAMAQEPAARYQSARDLADDLEHWLADEPVTALSETRIERLARWTRRHRAWAQAATVALLMITAVSLVAALLINRSRHDEQFARLAARDSEALALRNAEAARQSAELARTNERAATENAEAAERNAREARDNATAARQSEERAKLAAQTAERNAQAATGLYRQVVASMLNLGLQLQGRLKARPGSAEVPEARALSQEVLKTVSDNVIDMAKKFQGSGVTDFAMAGTYDQMGELLLKLGRGGEALAEFENGRRLVEQAAAQRPDDDVARANLALLTMKIGRTHLDVHDDAQSALKTFLTSRDLQREIMEHPRGDKYQPADNRRLLSMYEIQSGIAELRLGHPQEAKTHFEAALALRRAWLEETPESIPAYSYISECQLWLGTVAWHLDDESGAATNFSESLRICNELAGRFPNDGSFPGDLAEVYGAFGDAQLRLGKTDEARESYSRSREFLSRLLERNRGDASSQALLAQTLERQALLAERTGDTARAAPIYEEARALRSKLADLDPQNLSWQAARALTSAHCGRRAEAVEQIESLLARAGTSPGARLQAARCFAVCAQNETDAAQKRQDIDRALAAVTTAITDDFRDAALVSTDPELATLAAEPAFQSLLEKLKERNRK
jgi:serine/threonine-protein kinase